MSSSDALETYGDAIAPVLDELNRATEKWPGWPQCPLHAAAVVATEAGELQQAAMKHTYCWGRDDHMLAEAIQVAATAIRFIHAYEAGHYCKAPDPLPKVGEFISQSPYGSHSDPLTPTERWDNLMKGLFSHND